MSMCSLDFKLFSAQSTECSHSIPRDLNNKGHGRHVGVPNKRLYMHSCSIIHAFMHVCMFVCTNVCVSLHVCTNGNHDF